MESSKVKLLLVCGLVWLICGLAVSPVAGSIPLEPGFDLFGSNAGPCWVQSNGDSELPPIPADFFYPGSEPWTGVIELRGEPLAGYCSPVNMVIERKEEAAMPGPTTIEVELVELSLVSVEPIPVRNGVGASSSESFFDVFVSLDP
ncbi:MAG: hypothetical protein ACYS21_10945, partial [Planctomycetota bacterium]